MVSTLPHESFFSNYPAIIAVGTATITTIGCAYWSRVALPRQIDRAYRASLYALAAAVEAKDSTSVGHAKRVADHALAIGRNMALSKRELQRIEHAALLRDIGKVDIPHWLLNKPEPLSQDEFDRIKAHARTGSEMALAAPFLARCSEIILHHHEHWNGSGYPDGLKGEDIPLGSRIVAVADDYDAMVSDRPYHKALPTAVAAGYIRDGAGVEYDPAVVESFLSILEKEEIFSA
jgi:HD-GYP domain-containing protein (c-di-GMP phosphodiesterase class II)